MRLLIISIDNTIKKVLNQSAAFIGVSISVVKNIEQAINILDDARISNAHYDALCLFPESDDICGIDTIKTIRSRKDFTPIIVIDGATGREDALLAGADDVQTIPFSIDELAARLRVISRRRNQRKIRTINFGNVSLHAESNTMGANGVRVDISRVLFLILVSLSSRFGRVVSKDTLIKVSNGTIESIGPQISRLRSILQSCDADVKIVNLYGLGYRLMLN